MFIKSAAALGARSAGGGWRDATGGCFASHCDQCEHSSSHTATSTVALHLVCKCAILTGNLLTYFYPKNRKTCARECTVQFALCIAIVIWTSLDSCQGKLGHSVEWWHPLPVHRYRTLAPQFRNRLMEDRMARYTRTRYGPLTHQLSV